MRGGKRPGAGRHKGHTSAVTIRISNDAIFQMDAVLIGEYGKTRSQCIEKLILKETKRITLLKKINLTIKPD